MKRIVCLLLSVWMGAAFTGTALAGASPEYLQSGESFTYWAAMNAEQSQYYSDYNQHPLYQWMEKMTGVHVEFQHPSIDQKYEQLNLLLASNSLPDVMEDVWYPDGPQAGIDDGVFLDLTDLVDQYMPNYKAALACADGSLTRWEWTDEELAAYKPSVIGPYDSVVRTNKGRIWCVTQPWYDSQPSYVGPFLRKDWLDEAGLQIPKTLADWETVLIAFKERGAVPLSINPLGYDAWSGSFASAFNIAPTYYVGQDGKVHHGFNQPELKEYLTLMNRWYTLGLIDPDFMNRDEDSVSSLMLSDRLGAVQSGLIGSFDTYLAGYTGEQAFDLTGAPYAKRTADQVIGFKQSDALTPFAQVVITKDCKNPELVCRWLDQFFTKDAYLMENYGIENEDYTMVDGRPMPLDRMINDPDMPFFTARHVLARPNGPYCYSTRMAEMPMLKKMLSEGSDSSWQARLMWDEAADDMCMPYVPLTGEEEKIVNNVMTQVETYANEMILKFITGVEPLERFDTYLNYINTLGMEEVLKIQQTAYDRVMQP